MNKEKEIQWYALEPTDAWFFRDGRPSNRGEDQSDLESLFPPNARTVVGAFRAALARSGPEKWDGRSNWSEWGSKITDVLGDGDDLKNLSFIGPFLSLDSELLFPVPNHILGIEHEDDTFEAKDCLVPSEDAILCDLGKVHLPEPRNKTKNEDKDQRLTTTDNYFVKASALQEILNGKLPDYKKDKKVFVHRKKLFSVEPRVGIELEHVSRTTKEGALYNPVYVRLCKGVKLVEGISGLPEDWEVPKFFPLGGESRLAACDKIEAPFFPKSVEDGKLLITISPCSFDQKDSTQSWFGGGPGKESSMLDSTFEGKIKTTVFDRPMGIGGWDSVEHGPLPLKPFLQPGSLWWLEETQEIVKGNTDLRLGIETKFGYGIVLMGREVSQ